MSKPLLNAVAPKQSFSYLQNGTPTEKPVSEIIETREYVGQKIAPRIHKAVNWNREMDSFTQSFWDQNLSQMWIDTEFSPTKDKVVWSRLDEETKEAYKRVLAGLTLLDTKQGTVGMPKIAEHVEDPQRKAVLSFMGMMENIHAKSYSTIFTTLIDSEIEIDQAFEWVEDNPQLQFKAEHVSHYYENITDKKSLYLAMMASVMLESFLFYSGFFLPLYLSGNGKMVASGQIVKKIIEDESIHGVYVGLLAQELYRELTPQEQAEVDYETQASLEELMENEYKYTETIYAHIGMDHEVKRFLEYNANKAMMNLGKDPVYKEHRINPIVLNGLSTETETNDFFSTKSAYQKAKHRPLGDSDFQFPNISEELV